MEIVDNDLIAIRKAKLDSLTSLGGNPYGAAFPTTGNVAQVRETFTEELEVAVAGRITAHRDMGKSHFLDLSDISGRMQIYLHAKEIGEEAFAKFKLLDLGDFIGVKGKCFVTKTGEPSVRVEALTVLSKSLRPLPEKWHGLADVETRYRKRYLDLVSNADSREVFLQRITVLREIRKFLEDRGFLEVETPMMHTIAGGAAARPFQTHHNALSTDLFLRSAPELYLKRLLVGGFTKVFELNRNFRNEGISRRHNPEFTMLELYQAYSDFEGMADLVEELICHCAMVLHGTLVLNHKDAEGNITKTIDLTRPWKRQSYRSLIEGIDADWFSHSSDRKRELCREWGVEISPAMEDFEITQHVFEKLIEEKTMSPLFATHCPKQLVPLANLNATDDSVVDVYELVINGQEISPGYSELNNPLAQRARLEEQAGEEVQNIDEEFLTALEHGMPPAGGLGLGIDRLIMLLTGAESIRDVILFPHLKQKSPGQ